MARPQLTPSMPWSTTGRGRMRVRQPPRRGPSCAAEARARIEKLKPKAEEQRKKVAEYEQNLRASSKAAATNAVPDKVERPEKR